MDEYLRANQRLWDSWTELHEVSEFYDVDGFREGGVRITDVELAELGPVDGSSLLHLQCHFGIDTLSFARLGARNVTGVDFSAKAVALARQLAAELNLPATFVEANVYDVPQLIHEQFDVVYTSHGVLSWLPELFAWARVVAHCLAPGGRFYLFEGHPYGMTFDDDVTERMLVPRYPYFKTPAPLRFDTQGSYASPADLQSAEYCWPFSIGEVVSALIAAGLRLEFLHEHPFMAWRMLPFMEADDDGWWRLPPEFPPLPLSFSLRATTADSSAIPAGRGA